MTVSILAKIFDKCFVFSNSPDPLCYCLIPHYSTLKIQLTSLNRCENFSNRCRTLMCWRSVLESHINTIGKKIYFLFKKKTGKIHLCCYFIHWHLGILLVMSEQIKVEVHFVLYAWSWNHCPHSIPTPSPNYGSFPWNVFSQVQIILLMVPYAWSILSIFSLAKLLYSPFCSLLRLRFI